MILRGFPAAGPVDIHNDLDVVMRYLSVSSPHVCLDRFHRSHLYHHDILFRILVQSTNIQNYHARVTMCTLGRRYLRSLDVNGLKHNVLVVGCRSHVRVIKSFAYPEIAAYEDTHPFWCQYILSRLGVTVAAAPVWRKQLMNVQSVVSQFRKADQS